MTEKRTWAQHKSAQKDGSVHPKGHGSLNRIEDVLTTLGGSQRLEILRTLSQRPMRVSEIALALELELSAVSHNLDLLRRSNLVVSEKLGREVLYRLNARVCCTKTSENTVLEIEVAGRSSIILNIHIDERPAHGHNGVNHR